MDDVEHDDPKEIHEVGEVAPNADVPEDVEEQLRKGRKRDPLDGSEPLHKDAPNR
jgi:hypothetical protein